MRTLHGTVVKGLGGLYETLVFEDGAPRRILSRAKGALHKGEEKLLIGDRVAVQIDEETPDGVVIASVDPRRNALIRPPMANLDLLFAVVAARRPEPALETLDKLLAIAEHNAIEPVVVVTKADLDPEYAESLAEVYRLAGFPVFLTSSEAGEGIAALKAFVFDRVKGGATAAFSGASGVGKSTLLNRLFPDLSLATSGISEKIGRGKHTTRHVELFPLSEAEDAGFLADTPGFSLLDFEHFDFFPLDALLPAFRDLLPYAGKCRYADCAHVGEGEAECAVAAAAKRGEIAPSRLASYRALYRTLKQKEKTTF